MSDKALFVIQRFENGEWLIQDVKEGDRSDFQVKKMAVAAYIKAIEWDHNLPVRLIAYYGEGFNRGDDREGPIRILNHQPEQEL